MKKTLVIGNSATMAVGSKRENSGNLIHANAARRLLTNYQNGNASKLWSEADLERIKSEFKNILLVAANTLAPIGKVNETQERILTNVTLNLLRAKLPVVTLGLGAQAPLGTSPKDIHLNSVCNIFAWVLSDCSSQFAVRGEFTAELLYNHGVRNAKALGCPSVFYHTDTGDSFPHQNKLSLGTKLVPGNRIAINYTSFWREYPILQMVPSGFDVSFIGQTDFFEESISSLSNMVGAIPDSYQKVFSKDAELRDRFFDVMKNQYRKFYDVQSWLVFLADVKVVFGSRFHGNMAGLLAGARAIWMVHDSRTKELCDYHHLPHVTTGNKLLNLNFSDLIDQMEYGDFLKFYPKNRQKLLNYLREAGVDCVD